MTIQAISADGVTHTFPDGTDGDVISRTMRNYAAASQTPTSASDADNTNTISADLQGGLHDLGQSVSQGANVVGGVMSRNGMPEGGGDVSSAGNWIASHTPDAPSGPSPSAQLVAALREGDLSKVPELLGHSALRAAPSIAPILAGGVIGGPVGAGVVAGSLAAGPAAYERAANNGRTDPATADVVQSLL